MELLQEEDLNLNNNQDEEQNQEEERKRTKRNPWLVLILLLILLLFLLSCYMLGSRLYDMATREKYVVNMVADEDTEISIFKIEYSEETGDVTVSGMDGEDVVAPGTENEYMLRLKNDDSVDIRYVLTAGQSFYTDDEVPLMIRLVDEHGNYLIGGDKEWAKIKELNNLIYKGKLSVGQVESLYFQWKWDFEGDDEYDTYLGNLTGEDTAGVNVAFWLDCSGEAQAAMSESYFLLHRHNWGCCYCCWLVLLLLLIILLLLLYIWRIRRKLRKREDELEELEERQKELEEQLLMFTQAEEGAEGDGSGSEEDQGENQQTQ